MRAQPVQVQAHMRPRRLSICIQSEAAICQARSSARVLTCSRSDTSCTCTLQKFAGEPHPATPLNACSSTCWLSCELYQQVLLYKATGSSIMYISSIALIVQVQSCVAQGRPPSWCAQARRTTCGTTSSAQLRVESAAAAATPRCPNHTLISGFMRFEVEAVQQHLQRTQLEWLLRRLQGLAISQ